MKKIVVSISLILFGLGFAGCASFNFTKMPTDITVSSNRSVAVAVHDQREYVMSGESKASYVGMARNGFGMPFSEHTGSGRPFADEITDAICTALDSKGFKSVPVYVNCTMSENDVLTSLKSKNTDRLIYVKINEMQFDVLMRMGLQYNVELTVYDGSGTKLAQALDVKEYNVSGYNSMKGRNSAVEQSAIEYGQLITRLFNDESIKRALK